MTATIIPWRPLVAQGRERVPGVNQTKAPGTLSAGGGGLPEPTDFPTPTEDDRAFLRWIADARDDIVLDFARLDYDGN